MPEVTFNLHTLGWHSFQQLCHSILRENLGQTVQSFLDERDGGRDGAFSGVWNPTGAEDLSGKFVVQCKFTKIAGKNLQLSEMSDDINKARRLVEQGLCDVYVLLTNAGESGTADELILYNHLKLGRQPRKFLEKIEDLLDGVASHRRFIPEIARRLPDGRLSKVPSPVSRQLPMLFGIHRGRWAFTEVIGELPSFAGVPTGTCRGGDRLLVTSSSTSEHPRKSFF